MSLARSCYQEMFLGCTSLVTAPQLNARALAPVCYKEMFRNCTSLVTAPALPASILTAECYSRMFSGCTSLNRVVMLANDISASSCLYRWLDNVAATGTFTKSSNMSTLPTGPSGIPVDWVIEDIPDWLALTSRGTGDITVTIPAGLGANITDIGYTTDYGITWDMLTYDDAAHTVTIPVVEGDVVMLAGHALRLADSAVHTKIGGSVSFDAGGNTMSLLDKENFASMTAVNSHAFRNLFAGSRIVAPPALPATQLAESCYESLFSGCTSLWQAPALPATVLAEACYRNLFSGCMSLTISPVLAAAVLAPYCYENMFRTDMSLNAITMLATDISAAGCLDNWVLNVTPTGTFTKAAAMTTLPTGASGIPDGWTVIDNV